MAPESKVNRSKVTLTARLKATMLVNEVDVTKRPRDVVSRAQVHDPNSFHRAISPVLLVAQCFAILPVEGITVPDVRALRFRWCRLRVLYTILSLVGSLFLMVVWGINMDEDRGPTTIRKSTVFIYEVIDTIGLALFLQLAMKWPKLVDKLSRLEARMSVNYGYPKTLARDFRVVASAVLLSSIVEHVLSNVKSIYWSIDCADSSHSWLTIFFKHNYPLGSFVSFSYELALMIRHTSNVNVFTWNFMDLLIILFSRFLTCRLAQINRRILAVKDKVMPEHFWREVREDYNHLSVVVKVVDDHISTIVLLSFGNNVFFICVQLLNSIQNELTREDYLYFYVSFAHLLLRSTAMCLFAASIHEQSKEPKSTLFSVPSESYSQEVQRLLMQVTTDDVALTGLNFFSITKTLLLTLAGTIVTYEIVLVQLNSGVHTEEAVPVNATHILNPYCPNRTTSAHKTN